MSKRQSFFQRWFNPNPRETRPLYQADPAYLNKLFLEHGLEVRQLLNGAWILWNLDLEEAYDLVALWHYTSDRSVERGFGDLTLPMGACGFPRCCDFNKINVLSLAIELLSVRGTLKNESRPVRKHNPIIPESERPVVQWYKGEDFYRA